MEPAQNADILDDLGAPSLQRALVLHLGLSAPPTLTFLIALICGVFHIEPGIIAQPLALSTGERGLAWGLALLSLLSLELSRRQSARLPALVREAGLAGLQRYLRARLLPLALLALSAAASGTLIASWLIRCGQGAITQEVVILYLIGNLALTRLWLSFPSRDRLAQDIEGEPATLADLRS